MAAFAEARYFGLKKNSIARQLPVTGGSLNAEQVLGSENRAHR
jgi:hypothetical protein